MTLLEGFYEEKKPVFGSHVLASMGPIYKKLQHQLVEYLDVPNLSLFVNGHMALERAIQALDLGDLYDHEVITTPFTFVSTSHAIARNHLRPVFCDIKPEDYTIDPEKIKALITEKTVAILSVHVYGNLYSDEQKELTRKRFPGQADDGAANRG